MPFFLRGDEWQGKLHLPRDDHAQFGVNNRGVAYQLKGENAKALSDYSEGLRLNPKDFRAHYNRGNYYSSIGNAEGAISDFSDAVALEPQFALGYFARGLAHERQGNRSLATEDFQQAKRLGYPEK